ncbi:hypothetical protein [Thiothrix fructosivorans]|uniref:Uncharacterized protein n=1 Tax=Thiothrix fructosivorans TaxID=111770 RepID=A0A8B0SQ58_9GAMM|nr:hypothetical protein [Thiothrix fructosivorans]MBO0611500.1 hypothetical protein [Thiothrix fructosivorans]QTX13079.1 hypothetical protein J1836_020475 [Thiothrix fructosivorans]
MQEKENGGITTAEIVIVTQANLVNKDVLTPFVALSVFAVVGLDSTDNTTAQQVICTLNLFCYLSHRSAMEWQKKKPSGNIQGKTVKEYTRKSYHHIVSMSGQI